MIHFFCLPEFYDLGYFMQIGWRILREIASSKNIHTQTMIFLYLKPIKIYKRQCRPLNSFKYDGYNFRTSVELI